MKITHKLVALVMAFALIFTGLPALPANAAVQTQSPPSRCYVRIRYAYNGKYLDVPAEGINENGTQLQLWDYAYGNQNQIFILYYTDKGWQIISYQSGKVIEVRNSSHDDYAAVSQWDRHTLDCAYWDIVENSDGTVSFRNRESKKFLNACGGGDAANATSIIQYHDDGTAAMKFYIDVLTANDVLSATYDRTVKNSELSWTQYNPVTSYIHNLTGFSLTQNGKQYYPSVGQKVFVSAEFLSPNTVANLVLEQAYDSSIWKDIASALAGDYTEAKIAALLAELGFDSVPGLGTALGILQILWENRDEEARQQFRKAVSVSADGRFSGVILYTYYTFKTVVSYGSLNNGTTKKGYHYYIRKIVNVEYKSWTGDNFNSVRTLPVSNTSGTWYYKFK